jgi:hypothetical protein
MSPPTRLLDEIMPEKLFRCNKIAAQAPFKVEKNLGAGPKLGFAFPG